MDSDDVVALVIFEVVWFTGVIVTIVLLNKAVKIVRNGEVMVLERFGSYRTILRPGVHFLIPFVDSPREVHWRYVDASDGGTVTFVARVVTDRIDMREHVIDFGKQHVITQDTVPIQIDALVYFRVMDAQLAVYNIQNLPDAVELLTQTTLRNVVAHMTLDDMFSSREQINSSLLETVRPDAERWGVSILRVEIFNIVPPDDIKRAMESQIKEERERRAMVLTADGERESTIVRSRGDAAKTVLLAEGAKTSRIQRAKGEAEAKMLIANAEASCMEALKSCLTGTGMVATDYMVAIQYLTALSGLTTSKAASNVVLIPSESLDVVGAIKSAAVGGGARK